MGVKPLFSRWGPGLAIQHFICTASNNPFIKMCYCKSCPLDSVYIIYLHVWKLAFTKATVLR